MWLKMNRIKPPRPDSRNRQRGSIAVEFALLLPVFMLMITGGFELSRYILIDQRVNSTTATIGDLVARLDNTATDALMNDILTSPVQEMYPYNFSQNGLIVVSFVNRTNNVNKITWQRRTGNASGISKVGSSGGTAALPAGLTLSNNESVVLTEFIYKYTPALYSDVVDPQTLYVLSAHRPRLVTIIPLT
jgi:Flp pilus assembly protein TadG